MTDERRAELARNLAALEERLAKACAAAGRARDDVTLVAVTKTYPSSDVRILAELGVTDVAENRDQEARRKAAECADDCPDLRWHFVGQLQRNKARSVVRYADAVHSVDRHELAAALAEEADRRRDDPLDVLLQVNLTPIVTSVTPVAGPTPATTSAATNATEPPVPVAARGGVVPSEALELAADVARYPALRLRGVMAVAPRDEDPDAAFARLATLAAEVRHAYPEAKWISAGMSGDLESAIRHGATHVRVGSALLGIRWPARGTVAG